MKKYIAIFGLVAISTFARADLIQQFKDPTFSGQGWASQVLTLEQMRNSAENSIKSKEASDLAAAAAAAQNTPLAKFMALFTGQVYSQLATQLTNNLFKECTTGACDKGEFSVTDTQKIIWSKNLDTKLVTLTVYDGKKNSDNSITWNSTSTQQIIVPISSFGF